MRELELATTIETTIPYSELSMSQNFYISLKKKTKLLKYTWIVAKVILQSKDNIIADPCLQITYCD